ncbi:DHHW family protein [Paraclostridium sp. AKS73]|uniref:DHHW family protein n=1 Tax=Paraclostridium sp. AKS73 TaxID=2876116 RepID=UPI0021DF834F|nr:DHHW family protein [Paraclostridium sp. AKS73]
MCLVLIIASQVVACSNKDAINSSKEGSSSEQKVDTSESNKTDSNATAEKSGSVITVGNKAFEIFNENKAGEKEYSQIISEHKKALGKDVQVYNMVVPTHVEFGLPENIKICQNQKKIL